MNDPFDKIAEVYDRWYDSAEGAAIFREELACLQLVCPERRGRWVEVGIGTGRFASALGIAEGIDPSAKMLEYAARRAARTHLGSAESLPFPDAAFDGALMALTLCFVADADQALRESFRILRPAGVLLLGIVPADSPWGRAYARKAAEGHPVYALAHFHTLPEIVTLAEGAGFVLRETASALFWMPGEPPHQAARIERGVITGAGFAALRFDKLEDVPEADAPHFGN
jgi:ubiquinone/menaquinone biosynthesis C-methylase UbiE